MEPEEIHVMFLPYPAPGHMMPMVDMARLLASEGVRVTIITTTTTTTNVAILRGSVRRDRKLGRKISLETVRFPWKEAGLPEECDNLISVSTPEMTIKFIQGIELLQPQIRQLFKKHRPDAIASDYLFPWTVDVALELGVPRLAFSGSGFFNLCVANSIELHRPHDGASSESEAFLVPGLPDQVRLTRSQLPDIVKTKTEFSDLFVRLKDAERKSFGVLMNSFYELEPSYANHFRNATGIKAWKLGPVSLFNRDFSDKSERGGKSSTCEYTCLQWLDSKDQKSVLYVCFGSLVRFNKKQILEIASALAGSGCSFIWVLGKVLRCDFDEENEAGWWLPDGFEEGLEASGKGIIIKGWAPQVMILEHPAVGGFLTHCGWNSILEGVCSGVPLLTWPIFAEQFYNEKLVTQVLNIGVPVGNETWKVWATQETALIGRVQIANAVKRLMGATDETADLRRKMAGLAESAKTAVAEGGSSYSDLKGLIEDIKMFKAASNQSREFYRSCSLEREKHHQELTAPPYLLD